MNDQHDETCRHGEQGNCDVCHYELNHPYVACVEVGKRDKRIGEKAFSNEKDARDYLDSLWIKTKHYANARGYVARSGEIVYYKPLGVRAV